MVRQHEGIELFGHDARNVWRSQSKAFIPENFVQTVEHGGGTVKLWGCLGGNAVNGGNRRAMVI